MPANPLRSLQSRHARALDRLMSGLASGKITPQQFRGRARTLFAVSHAIAAELGVQRGGGNQEVRRQVADRAVRAEMEFLRGFMGDVRAGRYARRGLGGEGARARKARAALYGKKLTGTANAAFIASMPKDVTIWWRLGSAEPCPTCPVYAAGSPYTRATLPAVPGEGKSECLVACKCRLETDAGVNSFANA